MTEEMRQIYNLRNQFVKEKRRVRTPTDILPVLDKWAGRSQEHFIVVTLNGAHEIVKARAITKGLLNRTIVHPREVFRCALKDNAAAVILAHNHPSSSLEPSSEDIEITRRLKSAGELLGISVLDHIIFCRTGSYSFLEHDKL